MRYQFIPNVLFLLCLSLLLVSCGIHPVNSTETDPIPSDEINKEEQSEADSDSVETELPIIPVEPEQIYYREYPEGAHDVYRGEDWGGNGTWPEWYWTEGRDAYLDRGYWLRSYLADDAYIAEHTVGIYYIKNKGYDKYLDLREQHLQASGNEVLELRDLAYSDGQKFRLVEMDDGRYALLTYLEYTIRESEQYVLHDYGVVGGYYPLAANGGIYVTPPHLHKLWFQSFTITPTESGAYKLESRYAQAVTPGQVMAADTWECGCLGDEDCSLVGGYDIGAFDYTADDDYRDEWIFVPVEEVDS